MSVISETLLYMAARAQLVDEVISPALQEGRIVLCDRFLDSTIAYQGYGLGMDTGIIKKIGALAIRGLKPDLTLLLDTPLKQGLRHRAKIEDRIEQRSLAYHSRVRKGYFRLAQQEPERIRVIRLEKERIRTQQKIRKIVLEFLSRRRRDATKLA
jgi:dTMP kinase